MSRGRSGCVVPAHTLMVPSQHAALLDLLLDDVIRTNRYRRQLTDDFRAWLQDLHDVARKHELTSFERPAPSEWISTEHAAELFAAAGVALSARSVRSLAASGKLQSRRDGHRWLVGLEDVFEEIEARLASRKLRKSIGCRDSGGAGELDPAIGSHLEEAS